MATQLSTGFATAILGDKSFAGIFAGGCIEIYSGTQPANADIAASGNLLARVTRNGGTWTPGSPANGLLFQNGGRYVAFDPSHEYRLAGLATGTAGWFRLVSSAADGSVASTSLPRIDGAIGLDDNSPGDFQMRLPTLSITPTTLISIPSAWWAIPPL